MIQVRVTALMIAAAHIAIAGHLLAAFHFRWSHRWIWQASEQRGSDSEADHQECPDVATPHKNMARL